MRFAVGCFLSAVVLIGSHALGITGAWALAVAAVVLLLAAVVAAVAMEAHDDLPVGDLVAASAALRQPSASVPSEGSSLDEVA
jgi:hypothetical protein